MWIPNTYSGEFVDSPTLSVTSTSRLYMPGAMADHSPNCRGVTDVVNIFARDVRIGFP